MFTPMPANPLACGETTELRARIGSRSDRAGNASPVLVLHLDLEESLVRPTGHAARWGALGRGWKRCAVVAVWKRSPAGRMPSSLDLRASRG